MHTVILIVHTLDHILVMIYVDCDTRTSQNKPKIIKPGHINKTVKFKITNTFNCTN